MEDLQNKPKSKMTMEERVLTLEYKEERRQQHYVELKKDMDNMSMNVEMIKSALIGNSLNNETGFVFDVKSIKNTLKEINTKYESTNTKIIQYGVYFNLIGAVCTVFLGALVTIVVKLYSN